MLTTHPSILTSTQSAKWTFSPKRAMARINQLRLYPAAHSTECNTSPSDHFSQFRRSSPVVMRAPVHRLHCLTPFEQTASLGAQALDPVAVDDFDPGHFNTPIAQIDDGGVLYLWWQCPP